MGRQTPQQIVDQLLELPDGTRYQLLAPVVRGRKGEFADLFSELQSKGFARARVDGELIQLTAPPTLQKQVKHSIEVVVDRLVSKSGQGEDGRPEVDRSYARRLTDSVETALGLADGIVVAEFVDAPVDGEDSAASRPAPVGRDGEPLPRERRFSERMACPNDHPLSICLLYTSPSPRD